LKRLSEHCYYVSNTLKQLYSYMYQIQGVLVDKKEIVKIEETE